MFRLDLLPEDVARLADGLRRLVGTAGQIAAGLEGTTAYLAMDNHAAETFDVALRHLAPAPIDSALPILRAMAAAIDAAWDAGPIFGHGALHPRDVFLTPGTDELDITGFGVAPALEAIGARPPVRRPYTAPERAAGEPWDARADVYSLGAIAHELLTGRRPAGPGEQDGTLPATMAPVLRVRIRRVLSKALAELPAERFRSGREFVEALADPSWMPAPEAASIESAAVTAIATAPPSEPIAASMTVPVIPPPAPRVQRTRVAAATPKPPARVAVREPDMTSDVTPRPDSPHGIDDIPLRRDNGQLSDSDQGRLLMPVAPLAMPPAFPWLAFAAASIACLVLGAAIGYQFALQRHSSSTTSPPASVTAAPAKTEPRPAAPAATDTEVAIPRPAAGAAPTEPAHQAAQPPVAPKAPGRVLVRSTPPGASVSIDGRAAGRTPVTLRDLTLAAHTIVVTRSGFSAESRRVTLTRRAPSATLTIALKAEKKTEKTTGSLTVDSRPKGARVTMDGRALGSTPLNAPGLTPGAHSVHLELAGYKPVTTSVTVKAGETTKLALTLEIR